MHFQGKKDQNLSIFCMCGRVSYYLYAVVEGVGG